VTIHIAQKLKESSIANEHFEIIRLISSKAGLLFFQDTTGDYWRIYNYVHNSRSYDKALSPDMAYEAGKAFGTFQLLTSDIDASTLYEVLPDFHHIGKRLETFRNVVLRDPYNRVREVKNEIGFVEARAEEMHTILRLGEHGHIPIRVTHNDTKFNNVLFNHDNKAISVVDLDTVMPGYILYDFGDAIRTGANTGAEDDPDLTKVNIDLSLFEAYSSGYLSIASKFLNQFEIKHLALSAKIMTYLIGLRFLTDYIDGDHYYKTGYPEHNLQRSKVQFRLLQSMEQHFGKMQEIINFIA
jgi:thiamine kinase-like enzyme